MHLNIIFIIYNYILINAIPENLKKKHFEVKLILNKKKEKFKLFHQNLVIRIGFSNSSIHKELVFSLQVYTENFSIQRT